MPSKYFYRCTNRFRGGSCKKGAYISCEELDRVAEDIILASVGQWQQYERAGTGLSYEKELGAAEVRLTRLEADYLAGKYDGEGQEDSYWRMHKSLSSKVRHLKKQEAEHRDTEQKLVMPEQVDWLWRGWNVPEHWASPHLLEDPEARGGPAEGHESMELPMTLRVRWDRYEQRRSSRGEVVTAPRA
ncbi:hypothetical protein ACHGLA_20755 [Streptomyces sp. YH02]|uniref:hypothetical protein n=1 Tax=Streptomyces sp. YH02 TaxID=3256999 RepID=UPI00375778CA